LSGNHLSALPTQVPYTAPPPTPPTAAAKYSIGSEFAYASNSQLAATITDATSTTTRGPYLSTTHPSIGTSHVSTSTKIVNATWIAGFVQ
jgi:hypothetical protein